MRSMFAAATILLALLTLPCTAADPAKNIGATPAAVCEAFSLPDAAGAAHSHAEWQGKKAVVLLFLATECPVSNSYSPDFARIAKAYSDRGVLVYGVHCDPDVSAADAAKHADEYGLKFPILLDPRQKLAAAVGANHPRGVRSHLRGHSDLPRSDR